MEESYRCDIGFKEKKNHGYIVSEEPLRTTKGLPLKEEPLLSVVQKKKLLKMVCSEETLRKEEEPPKEERLFVVISLLYI